MIRKTKIVATLGPASDSEAMITKLAKAGVNVFRINFSHSTNEKIVDYINKIHRVREALSLPISIMVDTRGPEVRVKSFEKGSVMLKKGENFSLVSYDVVGDDTKVSITQKICVDNAKVGGVVLANDGRLKLIIKEKKENELVCKVCTTGELKNNKSLSFAGQHFEFEYLNDRDKENLKVALELGIEYISASFVNTKSDLDTLKEFAYKYDKNVGIISKIENMTGLQNLDEILQNCEGVMVARGDLGVETKFEKLPIYQRKIINSAHKHSKICIVATEMLESMISSIRPTRAEISDVAKAVFDGAGAVMLSGESAVGCDPVNCVSTMSKIVMEAEKEFNYLGHFEGLIKNPQTSNDLVIQSAINAGFYLNCKAIVSYTSKGSNALKLSSNFSKVPIVAVADSTKTFNALAMMCNVIPVLDEKQDDIFAQASKICLQNKIASKGNMIIVTTGTTDSISNVLKFQEV